LLGIIAVSEGSNAMKIVLHSMLNLKCPEYGCYGYISFELAWILQAEQVNNLKKFIENGNIIKDLMSTVALLIKVCP